MAQEVKVVAKDAGSANLTMTDEYLIVKGPHYNLSNGYINRTEQTKAISVKDILNVEYVTMRSKRLFMIFITLMSLVTLILPTMRKVINDRQARRTVKEIYNHIQSYDTAFIILKLVIAIHVILIVASVLLLILYFIKCYRFLRISSVGAMIAVERKYYSKAELNNLYEMWKKKSLETFL